MKAPAPKKINKLLEIHNDTRVDPYYWMNDLKDPDVMTYLQAENDYCKFRLQHTDRLQETIFQEITGRIKQEDQSVPYLKNHYWYQTRYRAGAQQPQYWRWPDNYADREELLWDAEEAKAGHAYYHAGSGSVSPDNLKNVFGEDIKGRRIYTLRTKDLETGTMLEETIPNTSGYAVWAADSLSFYYVVKDDKLRPCTIKRHQLGQPVEEDEVIYHESDETFICFIQKSKNEEYLFIGSSSTVSDEYRYLPLKHPNTGWQIFLPRQRHLEYSLEHHGGYFFIRTNWEAINFRLMQCPVDRTGKDYWEEVLPHDPAGYLDDIEVFQDHLVTLSRAGASKEVRIFDLNTMASFNVPFPEEARNVEFDRNPEFAANKVRVQYTSLITPPSVIDVHLGNGEQEVLKVQEVVGGYEASDYHTERIWAEGVDGTNIPVSLVYRKDLWKPSKSPGLLYGYGSYGISIDPYFSIPRLSLLDRGFVYAIAHIRGGQELGRNWYEAGKLKAKRNTFEDFIACGQKLIDAQFVCAEGLAAMGGSAGGLLVGAAMNMAPGLFSAVVAAVPFVDVVTTMLDDSIPLTTGEYDEWGNPQEKAYYDLMKSYSPYDNIDSKPYPALLVTAGLHDSQVQYWEPAKWVAKLRDHTTEDHLIVLHTNLDAGHSGASGRFEKHRETALEYAFIIDQALCGPKSS